MAKINKVIGHPLMRGIYHIVGACTAATAIGIRGIGVDTWLSTAVQPVAFGALGALGAHSLIKRVVLMRKEGLKVHFLPALAHGALASAFISQLTAQVPNIFESTHSLIPVGAAMLTVYCVRRARIALRKLTTTEESKASK